MTTGDRIRAARIQAGLTQTDLAERIGVKFSAVHKYESGIVVNLKRDTIAKIAEVLNVKPSYLLCMDDETEIYSKLKTRPELRELLAAAGELTTPQILQLTQIAKVFKGGGK